MPSAYENGYNDGYTEGYSEGYSEGYAEAKAEFNKEHSPKKMKLEKNQTISEYVEPVYAKKEIKEILRTSLGGRNYVDIYYEGGSSHGWRNGCRIITTIDGNVLVSYYHHLGNNLQRTFKLNKIKAVRYNEDVIKSAILSYEDFHNMEHGTATIEEVQKSSAGIGGWFNSVSVSDDLIQKLEKMKFNSGSSTKPKKRKNP